MEKPYRKGKKHKRTKRDHISNSLSSLLLLCPSALTQMKIHVINSNSVHNCPRLQRIWQAQQTEQDQQYHLVSVTYTEANSKAEVRLPEKSIHKQKKSTGNSMLISAKYRMMVFSLPFLAVKSTWKIKGQTKRGLKDSHSIGQTKEKHYTKERGGDQTRAQEKCQNIYLPKFHSVSTKGIF